MSLMENSGERVGIIKKPEMYFLQRTKDSYLFHFSQLAKSSAETFRSKPTRKKSKTFSKPSEP